MYKVNKLKYNTKLSAFTVAHNTLNEIVSFYSSTQNSTWNCQLLQ